MHTNIRLLVRVALATCAACGVCDTCGTALAQSVALKVGVIRYEPHSTSDGISGIGIPPGADAKIGGANTLLLTAEYELQPHWGVELVLGVPPKITGTATGSVAFLGEVVTARNVAPTLLFTYRFGEAGATLRPYIGVGVNYTKFTNASSPYGYEVKLSDSTGAAAEVGLDYAIDKRWGLFASLGYADVRSKLVATGATVLQSNINFRPRTYSIGGSFRF